MVGGGGGAWRSWAFVLGLYRMGSGNGLRSGPDGNFQNAFLTGTSRGGGGVRGQSISCGKLRVLNWPRNFPREIQGSPRSFPHTEPAKPWAPQHFWECPRNLPHKIRGSPRKFPQRNLQSQILLGPTPPLPLYGAVWGVWGGVGRDGAGRCGAGWGGAVWGGVGRGRTQIDQHSVGAILRYILFGGSTPYPSRQVPPGNIGGLSGWRCESSKASLLTNGGHVKSD